MKSNQGHSGGRGNDAGAAEASSRARAVEALGDRQGDLREKLQSLIDRLRIDGAKPAEAVRRRRRGHGRGEEALGDEDLDSATQAQSRRSTNCAKAPSRWPSR